jgi:hypothetical protein
MFSSGFIGDQVLGSGDRVHDSGVAYPSLVGRRGGDPRPGSGSLSRDCAAPLAVAFELGVPRKHLDPAHREVVAVGALARRSGGWCQEVLNAGAQVHPRDKRGPPQGKPHPAPRPCVSTHDQRRQRRGNRPAAGNSARSATHRARRGRGSPATCNDCGRRCGGAAALDVHPATLALRVQRLGYVDHD